MVTEPEDVLSALAPMLREGPGPGVSGGTRGSARRAVQAQPARAARSAPDAGCGTAKGCWRRWGRPPIDIDELGRATGLPARAIQVALLELALAGRVERHGHQLVSLQGVSRRGIGPRQPVIAAGSCRLRTQGRASRRSSSNKTAV